MRKIIIVANNLAGGGAEKSLLIYLRNINLKNFEIDLLLIKKIGVYLDEIPVGVNLIDTYGDEIVIPKCKSEIKKAYKKHIKKKYDVEIAFLEGPPTLFVSCSNNKYSKKYAWIHTDLYAVKWTEKYFASTESEAKTFKVFDKRFFVSESNRKIFADKFGIFDNNYIMMNPVDTNEILEKSKQYKISKSKFSFCYVANFNSHKNHSMLLNAAKKLIDKGYDFILYLVGYGALLDKMKNLSKSLEIQENIFFSGFIKNPFPYVLSSDVFIHVSIGEGFPYALCESLILNKPILATNCAGNRDVLDFGEYGFLVDITENSIARGMERMINENSLREYYLSKASIRAQQFAFEGSIKEFEILLDER